MAPTIAKRINSVEDAPPDAYLFYDLDGGMFYVPRKKYSDFSQLFTGSIVSQHHFTMDLASAQHHSLVFDLDFKQEQPITTLLEPICNLIHSTLTFQFLPLVDHFTYIIAMRPDSAGIHIHLPEFTISHDDYILLCHDLNLKFRCAIAQKGTYHLDVMINMMLSGCGKKDKKPYQAIQIIYIDEKGQIVLKYNNTFCSQVKNEQKKFRRNKKNVNSFFRKLLVINSGQYQQYINQYMMPVTSPHEPLYRLSYMTHVNTAPMEKGRDVANFIYKRDKSIGYISKGEKLLCDGTHFLRAFQYIRFNSFTMEDFKTNNYALKQWYKRHLSPDECDYNPLFAKLNQELREDNVNFSKVENPIKLILEYNEGYYFIPVFYALCKNLNLNASELVQHLSSFINVKFQTLLHRLEQVDANHIETLMTDVTSSTIHFCANNLYQQPTTMRNKLKRMVQDSKRSILNISNQEELSDHIRCIQERYFPIRVLCMCNSLKKPTRYYWNFLNESWQEVSQNTEIHDHLCNLWMAIKTFLNEYKQSDPSSGPDEKIFERFNLNLIVSGINSDTVMEKKNVQMDRHKWFIRLPHGTLDLLTTHIGGTVPELFLSDRKLGIDISRDVLIKLLADTCPIVSLYELLTTKTFFLRYLKQLFLDKTDDLFHTLCDMIYEELPEFTLDEYSRSMLHFYAHLCKYMAFEYDILMYMLDILSSIFIATNYDRKFFVLKGVTGNGKSKLFELLSRMFGGYYHNIQADNLKPSSSSSGNATPELASTLFSCRIVTLEELESKINENRVKQITGNSEVTFRNLYEANMGGIPTAKIFSTTNKLPECHATQAFKERVVALPFHATFVEKPPDTTYDQVRLNLYHKDSYVVENSYNGCFLMLYYHLQKYMTKSDGLLHYRDKPDCVVEYTKDYLTNTDIYNQFKMCMDVQIQPEGMTTMNDLKSAVRQFLKEKKNLSMDESELVLKFEDEFGEYRQLDIQLNSFRCTGVLEQAKPLKIENSALSEEVDETETLEQPAKRAKLSHGSVIYYEKVIIKNLKRTSSEN